MHAAVEELREHGSRRARQLASLPPDWEEHYEVDETGVARPFFLNVATGEVRLQPPQVASAVSE